MKRILGMGNALTDILLQVDSDNVLQQLSLPKGSMQLVDEQKSKALNTIFADKNKIMATGGSASNTINGITRLGGDAGFVGKIADDFIGNFFLNDSINNKVKPHFIYSTTPSGQCTVLVSPDGERTMSTYLGAACELGADELNSDMFAGYDIFHIEGYLVQNHDLIRKAVVLAKENGLKVSIDLASYNVVEANLDFLQEIVAKYVDIVFANEEEARSFSNAEPEQALDMIAQMCEIAVVKVGKDGSFVKSGDEKHFIQPRLSNCIDTTGAGDLYAAGFLFGLATGMSLDKCGALGAYVSGNVVEVIGAKMNDSTWMEINNFACELSKN